MKGRSIALLLVAELAAMSLWFVSAAILPEMLREAAMSPVRQAALSSGVQGGFVIGALLSAWLGLSDRINPRLLFAACAVSAGLSNALLVVVVPGGALSIAARIATGIMLAGVYPVGMKIAVGWGQKDRGFLVGLLIGALTLGSALPHILALAGGANWRLTVLCASAASFAAGIIVLGAALGPYHVKAPTFDPRVIGTAWSNGRVRLAYAGYLGHMWELYAMWAWIAAASATSYGATMAAVDAELLAKITAFSAIAAGGLASVVAGFLGDRIGKAEMAAIAMAVSGASALLVAVTFGGQPWLTFVLVLLWGISIVPDSAQFSALVADASPPSQAGSLMTFQTALGFALTFATVQIAPVLAAMWGWPVVLAGLALGPAAGIVAMLRLRVL
jgi:MFS family permease